MEQEYRVVSQAWPEADFELRAVGDGMEFRGYAAVFNSQSEDLGGFRETLTNSAFDRSINAANNGSADVRMFLNHDTGRLLASTKARTLRLSKDDIGLIAETTLPDTTDGRDLHALIRRGDVRSMSFGFSVPRKAPDGGAAEEWSSDRTSRTLRHVTLHEVSPVTGWPAYAATSASVRHLLSMVDWSEEDSLRSFVDTLSEEQRASLLAHLTPTPQAPLEVDALRARLEAKYADLIPAA